MEEPDVLKGTMYTTDCDVVTSTISLGGRNAMAFDFMVPVHLVTNTAETTSTSSTTTDNNQAVTTSTSSFGSDPTELPLPVDGDGGLSVGAKAAIGVVVPVVSIIIAIAAFFLYRRRKAKNDNAAAAAAAAVAPPPPPAAGDGSEIREYKAPIDPLTGVPVTGAPMGAAGVPVYQNQMMGSPQSHNPYELQGGAAQYQPQDQQQAPPAGGYYKPAAAAEVSELPTQQTAFELPATEAEHQQPVVSPVARNSLPPSSPGNDIPRELSPVSEQTTPSVLTPGPHDVNRLSSTGGIPSSRAD